MSLPSPQKQVSFFDAAVLVEGLFESPTDRYRLFREKILPVLWAKREALAALYCADNGRTAIEPVHLLAVTLLQFMEKAPDRKAADNVRLHLGWKYAMDLRMDEKGFDHSTLERFRDRLLAGDSTRIGFEAILDGLREAGLVRKRSKQRLDSTHVLGAVARMSRLEVVRESVRLFVEAVGRWDPEGKPSGWTGLVERYVDSDFPWHRATLEVLKEKFLQAGADALGLIRWLRGQREEIRGSEVALVLERVFLEQYEWTPGAGVQRRTGEASGVVKNPHDPDVQWAAKDTQRTKQWEGYKVQIAETVAEESEARPKGEPTEQFVVEVTTTPAIASDLSGMRQVLEAQRQQGLARPSELYVDTAYVTDDTLAQAQQEGYELIGPARASPAKPGDPFRSEDFTVSVAERKATCPQGCVRTNCSRLENQQDGTVQYRFEWGAQCDACPQKARCTASRSGRRALVVGEHHDVLQARRQEMKTEAFRQRLRQRNGIEGTISEFARGGGRRTRYRGLFKTTLANYFAGAALNVNRWLRLLAGQAEMAVAGA